MAPALWHGCCKGHLSTWHHEPAHTAWGLLQIGFLCHRKGRNTTDREKTTTPKVRKHHNSQPQTTHPGKLHIPGQSKAHQRSTRSWRSQLGSVQQHKRRSINIPIYQHNQEKNTAWFSAWSLTASQWQAVISGQSRHKRATHKCLLSQHAAAKPCSSPGTLQHPTGHRAKEQKKQGYVLIPRQATRRPPSQAVEDAGSTSSVHVGRRGRMARWRNL